MKNTALLQLSQLVHEKTLQIITHISVKHHLSESQSQQIAQYYRQPQQLSTFIELYSQSMLRCDCVKYQQLTDEINDLLHQFYISQTDLINTILKVEKNEIDQNNNNNKTQKQLSQQSQTPTQPTQIDEAKPLDQIKNKYKRIDKQFNCDNCVCYGQPSKIMEQETLVQCILCLNYLHYWCLGKDSFEKCYKNSDFVCPSCVLKYMDHFNCVKQVLLPPSPFQAVGQINHKAFNFASNQAIVNIRCVRHENRINSEEITWPDAGELFLNSKRIEEFKPLINNHCLKKRKDEHILTTEVQQQNCLQIKESNPNPDMRSQYRISTNHLYFVSVYSIEQFNVKQLLDYIVNAQENWMSIEQSQDFIALCLEKLQTDEITIDSIAVQLTCSLAFNMMTTPVRGWLCQHIQCFGLENYLTVMYQMKPRKWRCPICKKKLFAIQIDAYQYAILQTIKIQNLPINEIAFNTRGNLINNLQLITDSLPSYGIKNNNRIIQLEVLSNSYKLLHKNPIMKNTPISQQSQQLSNAINNLMSSKSTTYNNLYANNYYQAQMKLQQQTKQQHRGITNDSAIVIE